MSKLSKYYLYKKVLTSPECVAPLDTKATVNYLYYQKEQPIMEAYQDRAKKIIDLTKTQFIEDLKNIDGKDIKGLFVQVESIQRVLTEGRYAEILITNGNTFAEVLEGLFDVTLNHIKNYEKAEQLLTGKRIVTVILDGNNTHVIKDDKEVMVQMEIQNNEVTIEKCRELIKKLNSDNCYPKQLEFLLSIYTETNGNDLGDSPEECLLRRKAYYCVDSDDLTIEEE